MVAFDTSAQTAELEKLRPAALDDLFVCGTIARAKIALWKARSATLASGPTRGFATPGKAAGARLAASHLDDRGEGALFSVEFFVDGETTPSLRATDEELIAGAGRFPCRWLRPTSSRSITARLTFTCPSV